MRYPKFIQEGNTIALIAPSLGSDKDPYKTRLKNGIKYIESLNFNIKKGVHLFTNKEAASCSALKRANDFIKMYTDNKINMVWSIGGGEIMMDILPHIPFETILNYEPKWFAGYSDNTNLTFLLTTLCDIATIYGMHIGDYGVSKLHKENKDFLDCITGKKKTFHSYQTYQTIDLKYENPTAPLNLTNLVSYETISEIDERIEGRLIGGCLDILSILCGTKYDQVKKFIEKYKEDGIIWYFDSCDFSSVGFYRALLQLSYAGWFENVKGFIIGRVANTTEPFNLSFKKAMQLALSSYNVPIIYNVDIGHVPPSIPIINGACCQFTCKDHKGRIQYILK